MRKLLLPLVLALLIAPVAAQASTSTFQNDYAGWVSSFGTLLLDDNTYSDTLTLYNGGGVFGANAVKSVVTNDFSFTNFEATGMYVGNASGTMMYNSLIPVGRVRVVYSGSSITIYSNGTVYTSSGSSEGPMAAIALSGTHVRIDDFSSDSSDVVGGPPHTWFVGKDMLNPSVKGLFTSAYANAYTDSMHVSYGSTTPNQTIYVEGCDPVVAPGYVGIATINLTPLLATSNYGVKQVTYGTASDYFTYKAVTITGTFVNWTTNSSPKTYIDGDPATVNYDAGTTYWYPSEYVYTLRVQMLAEDGSFTTISDIPISSQSGYHTYDTSAWTQGYYIAELIAAPMFTPTEEYYLATDWMYLDTGSVRIQGYVYDAVTMATIAGQAVNITQSGVTTSAISNATGWYEANSFTSGQPISFSVTRATYQPHTFAFTPVKGGTYNCSMYLTPNATAPTDNSTIVFGYVLSTPYGNAVPGATVGLGNSTYSATQTTTTGGYFEFAGLYNNTIYNINATATGFGSNSSTVTTGAVNSTTYKELWLTGGFNVTVQARNSDTLALISGTTEITLNGITASTTTGSYAFSGVSYGTYTASATNGNYNPGSSSGVITEDETIVVYLTPTGSTTTQDSNVSSQGPGQGYPPHNVRFTVQNMWGTPIANVNVTAIGRETTAGSFEWLYDILGWNTGAEIANSTLQGTTDHLGQINFMMFEAVKYNMTFSKSGIINVTYDFYPKDEYYTIVAEELGNTSWYSGGYNVLEQINSSVVGTEHGNTANITINYVDLLNSTTGGTIYLNQTNSTPNATEIQLYSFTVPNATITNASNWTYNLVVGGFSGQSYLVRLRMNSTTFGNVSRDYGVTFRHAIFNPLGLTSTELMIISCGLIVFMACLFGAVSAPHGGLLTCFVGWILWGLGWMDAMWGVATTALTLASVMAIVMLMMARSRKENWF